MSAEILIMEPDQDWRGLMSDYCTDHGYRPTVVDDFPSFSRAWRPDTSLAALSLSGARADSVDAIGFLADRDADAGLILTGDAGPRMLNAAGRLARARGLRVVGNLMQPFLSADLGRLLSRPRAELRDPTMEMKAQITRDDLQGCIRRGLVKTWFQPKIDIHGLELAGMEALVRIDHQALGIIGPGTFLRLAEESGLILELTEAIVCEAFSWGARWRAQGISAQLAVNLPPPLLIDPRLPNILHSWSETFALRPASITLEVTEDSVVNDATATLEAITRLRLRGFRISIDDFGTGYSNMALLNELPYNEMKLDQSFIRNAALDGEARAIVQSSIELGHKLGMQVVAEGVACQDDWDLVAELGCDECQGYFLARPMPPADLVDWLRRWNKTRGTH